jgi:hypothetical protein
MNGANLSIKDNFTIKAIALFSLATIAIYLLTQHRAHLLANSSYILLSGFILLHIFMCGGHGKHGAHGKHEGNEQNGGHTGHGGCCGGGHDHGKHKHKESEQKEPQNAGGHESTHHQYEHSQENYK